jgi:hypothetical protein
MSFGHTGSCWCYDAMTAHQQAAQKNIKARESLDILALRQKMYSQAQT